MGTRVTLLSLLVVLVVGLACKQNPLEPEPVPGADIRVNGTVRYLTIEGGFWVIRGDDGVNYDPMNGLPTAFQQEGMRVRLEAKRRNDMGGIHMAGPIVEILRITALK